MIVMEVVLTLPNSSGYYHWMYIWLNSYKVFSLKIMTLYTYNLCLNLCVTLIIFLNINQLTRTIEVDFERDSVHLSQFILRVRHHRVYGILHQETLYGKYCTKNSCFIGYPQSIIYLQIWSLDIRYSSLATIPSANSMNFYCLM